MNFMKEFKDKYKIDDDYIKQRELSLKRKDIQIFWNYYQYLKLKNFEKEFDYKKEFLKYTNNFGALTNYECSQDEPFSFFKGISYVFGLKKVKEIYKKLIQEYGEKNSTLINKSPSTGLLNINVLYDFAKYYIEQNLKDKNKM